MLLLLLVMLLTINACAELQHLVQLTLLIQLATPVTTNAFVEVACVLQAKFVMQEYVSVAEEPLVFKLRQMVVMVPCVHVEVIQHVLIQRFQHAME